MSEDNDNVVRKENKYGVMKDHVRTDIGTTVITTPKRLWNPITEQTEDLTKLSADGYCRRFLAMLSASDSPDVVDLGNSPILTFDKDRWEMREQDGQYVVVKRDAESEFGERLLENDIQQSSNECDWCDGEGITHVIDANRFDFVARFCSLQCAARWGCAADQDNIEEIHDD
jgi:hypothetical protein